MFCKVDYSAGFFAVVFFFFWLGLVVWLRLVDPFVSQNIKEDCEPLGRIPCCTNTFACMVKFQFLAQFPPSCCLIFLYVFVVSTFYMNDRFVSITVFKVNVTARLNFEVVYFEAAMQLFSHYATGTLAAKSIRWQILFLLLIKTRTGPMAGIVRSVYITKSDMVVVIIIIIIINAAVIIIYYHV